MLLYPRAFFRVLLLLVWGVSMVFCFCFVRRFAYKKIEAVPALFHRGCCFILSVKLELCGELTQSKPALFVSNHVSYIDVVALGAHIPGFFIAKSEVATWPLLGALAKLQNTLFFQRASSQVSGQVKIMQQHLMANENLILFPEGTSTEGAHVEPFKSSLFAAAELKDKTVLIQPVTIVYRHYTGRVMNQNERDAYAWYGAMPFFSHFIKMAGQRGCSIKLMLDVPVDLNCFESRKACALHCWSSVAGSLADAISTDFTEVHDHAKCNI